MGLAETSLKRLLCADDPPSLFEIVAAFSGRGDTTFPPLSEDDTAFVLDWAAADWRVFFPADLILAALGCKARPLCELCSFELLEFMDGFSTLSLAN